MSSMREHLQCQHMCKHVACLVLVYHFVIWKSRFSHNTSWFSHNTAWFRKEGGFSKTEFETMVCIRFLKH